MWQSLVHEIDPKGVEIAVDEEATPGVSVWRIVVGTSSVVVMKIEERMVDMIVEAGTWVVTICVDPG